MTDNNFVQTEYHCKDCNEKHFGNCPKIETTLAMTDNSEPTIDPSAGLIIDLEAEVKSIGNYLGCNEDGLWAEISKLISDQVAKARIEEIDAIPSYGLEEPTDYACYDLNHQFNRCVSCYKQMRLATLNGVNNNE